jgi:hypothetical protein
MRVVTVTDRLRVEPDHVYVIPPNADLTIRGGAFSLTPRATSDRHTPIDHFLRSLAQEQAGRAIGVVLSGTGSDGTLALRAIKTEGGITFVQDEKSAKYQGMPQSARGRRLRAASHRDRPRAGKGRRSPLPEPCPAIPCRLRPAGRRGRRGRRAPCPAHRHRHRLRAVQVGQRPPPHRSPHAVTEDRRPRELRPAPPRDARRSAGPTRRHPHPGDRVLP